MIALDLRRPAGPEAPAGDLGAEALARQGDRPPKGNCCMILADSTCYPVGGRCCTASTETPARLDKAKPES